MKSDMRVVELVPAGGWYTKIIAPVVAEKGELYVVIGTRSQTTARTGGAWIPYS